MQPALVSAQIDITISNNVFVLKQVGTEDLQTQKAIPDPEDRRCHEGWDSFTGSLMHNVALDLLILLAGIWLVAVTLRPLGLPTVMGELIVGVLLGPAVLGWIEPNEAIQLLAEIGIFFLMFHAGVETQPNEFFAALRRSLGVAIAGAAVPFAVSFGVAQLFGLDLAASVFVGLIIGTATAVVITLKSLKDLGLTDTRVARIIVASCIINDLLTLILFSLVMGALSGGTFAPLDLAVNLVKVLGFFAAALLLGTFVYPRLTLPFRAEGGKGFTFVLVAAIAAGLFAEAIGLHMILGAYLAGLFFEERVAHPNLVKVVNDRAYGIAYSFLGPIFFISLGFSISFDISASSLGFIACLAVTVIAGQVVSAGGMALRLGMSWREALTVGVGMCGRAEMAFILAALALAQGVVDQGTFTILILTAFLLNLFTPLGLKGCSVLLKGRVAHGWDTHLGVFQSDKFDTPLFGANQAEGTLPAVEEAVVIYGYGPEVETLIEELSSRRIPLVVIEENEAEARRLLENGLRVVHVNLAADSFDLGPLAKARALVANGADDDNALFILGAREAGFAGPLVAMIKHPHLRGPVLLAGATAAFTPNHVLAAAIAVRASAMIGPRVAGVEPVDSLIEVAELRIHDQSPLANRTLSDTELYSRTGAHIVGKWTDDSLGLPPAPREILKPGAILVAVGTPGNIHKLNEIARPITQQGPIGVIGFADVGRKLVEILRAAGEEVRVVHDKKSTGVDVVGDVLDVKVLECPAIAEARVLILAMDSDGANLFAAAVVRDHFPEIPLLACVSHVENAVRVQRAGADFALSISQVAGQLLIHHVLGETISPTPRIKMVKLRPGPLAGRHPFAARIRERTGCSVVAVERNGEVIMEFPASFVLEPGDALYVCGTPAAFERYYEEFPT